MASKLNVSPAARLANADARRELNEMIEVFTSPPRFDYLNIRYFALCNVRTTKALVI